MESRLLAQDRAIVTPGEPVAEGMEYLPGQGTYRHGDHILANQIGILHVEGKVLKTQPLSGPYLPQVNDIAIAKVVDILMSGWRVDLGGAYSAVLPLKDATFDFIRKGADLTEFFDLGDYIVCKVTQVTSQNLIDISMKGNGLQKLRGGQFLRINSAKVPRLIGKHGSMIAMLKAATGCQIVAGQNGMVWISGEPEQEVILVNAINKIEREAHIQGLTERVKAFLEQATGKTVEIPTGDSSQQMGEEPRQDFRRDDGRREFGDRPPRREGGYRDGPRHDGPRGPRREFNDRGPRRDGPRHDGPRRDGPRPGNSQSQEE